MFFIAGIMNGKKRDKNGYLVGFLTGLGLILIIFLLNLIFFRVHINFPMLIYYSILLVSSIFGGIVGINKKKESKWGSWYDKKKLT